MPKAILKYDLCDLDDASDFRMANNARSMWNCLFDFAGYLRSMIKHGDLSEAECETYEKIRDAFFEFLDSNGVSLEDS